MHQKPKSVLKKKKKKKRSQATQNNTKYNILALSFLVIFCLHSYSLDSFFCS